jgi:hypothetical protein
MSDIQKSEGSGSWKSETPIEIKAMVIERIDGTDGDLRRAHKTRQNWIWMREVSV